MDGVSLDEPHQINEGCKSPKTVRTKLRTTRKTEKTAIKEENFGNFM